MVEDRLWAEPGYGEACILWNPLGIPQRGAPITRSAGSVCSVKFGSS